MALPGLMMPPGLLSAGESLELSFVGSTKSQASTTVTGHASIVAGDVLVLGDFAFRPSITPPSGFTHNMFVGDTGDEGVAVSYKIANGSEAGASISGLANAYAKILLVFRPTRPASAIVRSTPNAQITSSNPAPQTVAASNGAPPLIVLGVYAANGPISPRTFTPPKDGEVQQEHTQFGYDFWLAWKIYNTAPANVTIDMDDEGINMLASNYIQVS